MTEPTTPTKTRQSRWLGKALLVLVLFGAGGAGGWWLHNGLSGVWSRGPGIDAPPRTPGTEYLSFLAVGDTGHGNATQHRVAAIMSQEAVDERAELVLMLGDNFYYDGVASTDDPQWASAFEDVYDLPGLDVPFYPVLGNHDHHTNTEAQVEYTALSDKWRMPGPYYSFTRMVGGAEVLFVAIDTETMHLDDAESAAQRAWIEETLGNSDARWKIVFGHRPIGLESERGRLYDRLNDVMSRHDVDLYLCGHHHHLALVRLGEGTYEVISGAGSEPRAEVLDPKMLFASSRAGFVSVRLSRDDLLVQYLQVGHEPPFAFLMSKEGEGAPAPAAATPGP